MQKFARIISTFFFIGYFPGIPGTIASLAALAIFLIFKANPAIIFCISSLSFFAGFLFSKDTEKYFNKKDPRQVVIDEVAGMFLCLSLIPSQRLTGFVAFAAFLLFRIFDWVKPYPINRIQKLPGSLGIMLDDVIAAVYAVILLEGLVRIALWMAS